MRVVAIPWSWPSIHDVCATASLQSRRDASVRMSNVDIDFLGIHHSSTCTRSGRHVSRPWVKEIHTKLDKKATIKFSKKKNTLPLAAYA